MKIAIPNYQVRAGCEYVLEWNLPFYNSGSATVLVFHRWYGTVVAILQYQDER